MQQAKHIHSLHVVMVSLLVNSSEFSKVLTKKYQLSCKQWEVVAVAHLAEAVAEVAVDLVDREVEAEEVVAVSERSGRNF
jgi:hypothetical protein